MRIFVTGASGFVGTAIVQELLTAGHRVLGLVRSDAAASAVAAAGAEVHRGHLEDLDGLGRAADACDGVVHTAFVHDFSNIAASGVIDLRAIEAIGAALAGSGRPFVVTSAMAVLPPGRIRSEDDTPVPGGAGAHRYAPERAALALATRGVRASVVRLPPSVHGDGDHGFVPALIGIARSTGVSAYIGDGTTRWSAVHRLDAAHLYRLALEQGAAGAAYHAVADEGVPTRDVAAVIGRRLALPVVSRAPAEAAAHFGWLAHFFGLDMAAASARTRAQLGWQPRQPGLLADLEGGRYFTSAT
jgi:nucleoside-diphosphate-sugar epimerase